MDVKYLSCDELRIGWKKISFTDYKPLNIGNPENSEWTEVGARCKLGGSDSLIIAPCSTYQSNSGQQLLRWQSPYYFFFRYLFFCRCAVSNPSCVVVQVPLGHACCRKKAACLQTLVRKVSLGISMSTFTRPNQVPAFRRSVRIKTIPTRHLIISQHGWPVKGVGVASAIWCDHICSYVYLFVLFLKIEIFAPRVTVRDSMSCCQYLVAFNESFTKYSTEFRTPCTG